jgi:predicted transcriptional regulator
MIWLKKTAIVLLLLVGLPVTVLTTLEILDPDTPPSAKGDFAAGLVFIGLSPTALASGLIVSLRHQHQQKLKQAAREQEQIFLALLQESNGKLTTVQLATRANISLEEAKAYLDEKALLLNGDFDTTDTGAIVYKFPI